MLQIKCQLLIAILICLFCVMVVGAGDEQESEEGFGMREIVIGKDQAGKVITVSQGKSIFIHLEENPSTGYQWELDVNDKGVLSSQKDEFIAAPEDTLGRGGIHIFQLKAEASGSATITLRYKRPWEPDKSAIDHFEVSINVSSE
jgi:inhibitor of cysteine peptidase